METTLDVKTRHWGAGKDGVGRDRRESIEAMLKERRRRREVPQAAGIDTPDPLDLAREREEEALWLAILDRSHDLHRAAEEALERLESGRYGECVGCRLQIAPARLQVMPFAVRCLVCQERRERQAEIRRHTSLALEVES